MSCYILKRKTNKGIEDVKLPISSINGLQDNLTTLEANKLKMPIIRLANVYDKNNTMVINTNNPLNFCIEIINGSLKVGDSVQICVKQLVTYKEKGKRKYKLRSLWTTNITEDNVNSRFIIVSITESLKDRNQRLYKTYDYGKSTFSPLYIRVRRPIFKQNLEVDAYFSNIITVWKKYSMNTGRILIK